MVATAVLLLLHVPPPVALLSDVVLPLHITNVPVVGGRVIAFTFIVFVVTKE
jgi:hypothetical protein